MVAASSSDAGALEDVFVSAKMLIFGGLVWAERACDNILIIYINMYETI